MKRNSRVKIGIRFEKWVAQLLRERGYWRVRHNVIITRKSRTGRKLKYQVDIVYGLLSKRYVECKYRTKSKISAKEIAQLEKTLASLEIPTKRGVFITNTDYTPQAVEYARLKRIKIINGDELRRMAGKKRGSLDDLVLKTGYVGRKL